jgi:hypothetical protein
LFQKPDIIVEITRRILCGLDMLGGKRVILLRWLLKKIRLGKDR